MKLAIIFGGASTEHSVSVVSGTSVLKNLDKNKYEITPLYIDKNGEWYKYTKEVREIEIAKIGEKIEEIEKIDNIMEVLRNQEVLFPVLHGLYGEDGTIQGLFEMINVPYVGDEVLSSSVGMDKVYTKVIFDKAQINQTKYIYIRKYEDNYICIDNDFSEKIIKLEEITNIVTKELKFPVFVKPSNSGSSVGISKVHDEIELENAITEASKFDKKIIIEQGIIGREVECAVLGNEKVIASCIGEVKAADDFYSYDAKYNNQESKTIIPAEISKEKAKEIQELAIKAFKAIDGKGLSRVDFFIEQNTEKVYINEINTLPGFTSISMYPKLFEESGIEYTDLLDKLISIAFNK